MNNQISEAFKKLVDEMNKERTPQEIRNMKLVRKEKQEKKDE